MKARVDKSKCIGCGLCVSGCPAVFRMDDDGLAVAKPDQVGQADQAAAQAAADDCPVGAIEVKPEA